MTRWQEWAYPVPDDDFETLERILVSLPGGGELETVWEGMPYYIVEVDDPTAALYLRLAVRQGPPSDDGSTSPIDQNEVWVAADERAECERMLVEECASPAVWKAIARVAFASDEAHGKFRAAYAEIMGCPPPVNTSAFIKGNPPLAPS